MLYYFNVRLLQELQFKILIYKSFFNIHHESSVKMSFMKE